MVAKTAEPSEWQQIRDSVERKKPKCRNCDDLGFAPDADGVYHPCPCRHTTISQRRQTELEQYSGLSAEELTFRLDGVELGKHGRDSTEYRRAIDAARRLLVNNGWLTLTGPYGVGKTYMMCAIVNEGMLLKKACLYIEWGELLGRFKETFDAESQARYDVVFQKVSDADVLAIDELDPSRYKVTDWTEGELSRLLSYRYRFKAERATAIATNNYDELPEFLSSRMEDGRDDVVHLAGQDVRPGLRR